MGWPAPQTQVAWRLCYVGVVADVPQPVLPHFGRLAATCIVVRIRFRWSVVTVSTSIPTHLQSCNCQHVSPTRFPCHLFSCCFRHCGLQSAPACSVLPLLSFGSVIFATHLWDRFSAIWRCSFLHQQPVYASGLKQGFLFGLSFSMSPPHSCPWRRCKKIKDWRLLGTMCFRSLSRLLHFLSRRVYL